MKKWLNIGFICLLASSCTAKKKDLHELALCTNSTYPPYESIGPEGKPIGFDLDVAEAIADKLGKKLVIKEFAFDGLILGLEQKKCDFIMAGMSITPAREKEIAMIPYQGETTKSYYLLFWKEIPESIKNAKDIAGIWNKTIAVQVATWMEEYLSNIPDIVVKPLEATPELILEIKYRKSVASFVEPHVATEILAKEPNLKFIEVPLGKKDWRLGNGIGVKKSNQALTEKIQSAVQELKKEGLIKKFEKRWFHTQ
ncbi:MAG: transporter substrate-binding domain-containing protein [Deltaproteobacteria bacterium]|nr:transporter substrate-binding domain-containing protein [Deltaproteobacteria bacterium]